MDHHLAGLGSCIVVVILIFLFFNINMIKIEYIYIHIINKNYLMHVNTEMKQ